MITFKEFLKQNEDAAPMAPTSPKTVNKLSYATRELGSEFDGLKPKDYLKEPITSFEPLDQAGDQKTSSPVFIDLEDSEDDNLKGKIMHSVGNRQKMRNPNGTQYKGDLKDKPIKLRKDSSRNLSDLFLAPFNKPPGGGMGGAPPMGGMGGL